MHTTFSVRLLGRVVPFDRACRRCGVEPYTVAHAIARNRPRADYVADDERSYGYHLGRVRHFVDCGIPDPILCEYLADKGFRIVDGFHRYIAAHLRGDEHIAATVRGDKMPSFALRSLQGY